MRKRKPTQRDELLDNDLILRKHVMSLLKDKSVRRFAKNFSKLMGIRTNSKFICVYEPRLYDPIIESSINSGRKRKKKINKDSKLFVRTFITDSKDGQIVMSLISDEVAKDAKNRAKYVMNMIKQYNSLEGVLLHGE